METREGVRSAAPQPSHARAPVRQPSPHSSTRATAATPTAGAPVLTAAWRCSCGGRRILTRAGHTGGGAWQMGRSPRCDRAKPTGPSIAGAWRASRSCTVHSPQALLALGMPSLDYVDCMLPAGTARRPARARGAGRAPRRAAVGAQIARASLSRRAVSGLDAARGAPIHLSAVLLIVICDHAFHFLPSTSHERVIPGWTDRGARRGLRVVCVRLAPAHSRPPWLCLALFMRAR